MLPISEKLRENIERKQISIEAEEINSKDDLIEVEAEYIRLTDHRKILEKEENIEMNYRKGSYG